MVLLHSNDWDLDAHGCITSPVFFVRIFVSAKRLSLLLLQNAQVKHPISYSRFARSLCFYKWFCVSRNMARSSVCVHIISFNEEAKEYSAGMEIAISEHLNTRKKYISYSSLIILNPKWQKITFYTESQNSMCLGGGKQANKYPLENSQSYFRPWLW